MSPVARIIAVRTTQVSAASLAVHWACRWPLTGPHALGLFVTPLLCLYFVFVFVGSWTWGLPLQARLPGGDFAVALTFDDGPSPETTPLILDALARHGAHATFFVLGENVRRHPDLLRRIAAEGHTVGLHGDTHTPLVLLPARRVAEEIARARRAVADACPDLPAPVLLRPPHGFKTLLLPWLARQAGCRLVAWSADPRDYRERDPARLCRAALALAAPGAILLLHDGPANAPTAAALPELLTRLAASGLRCVPLRPLLLPPSQAE